MKNINLITLTLLALVLVACGQPSNQDGSNQDANVETNKSEPIEERPTWNVAEVVDEFGDVVPDQNTIVGLIEGTMSNSATAGTDVTVKIQVGEDNTSFVSFFEYGDIPGNLPDKKSFNIKVKTENGEVEELEQYTLKNIMYDGEGALLNKALQQSTPLKVVVDLSKASEYESTIYKFEIDGAELKAVLDKSN